MYIFNKTESGHLNPVYVTPDGVQRFLGCKPSLKRTARSYKAAPTTWVPTKLPQPNVPILDQGSRSDCVGHGFSTMIMKDRDSANMSFNLLSPVFLYDQINGGVDDGSDPADAAKVLQTLGICLMSTIPENFSLNKKNIPQSAYEEALRFVVPENSIYQGNNFNDLVNGFLQGYKGGFTINVGSIFNLDNNGIVTYTPGEANHWVAVGEELKVIPQNQTNDIWALEFDNSWGTEWGNNGKAFITSQHLNSQPNLEIFIVKYVSDDPQDPTNIPI